jgi:hypothetical protein
MDVKLYTPLTVNTICTGVLPLHEAPGVYLGVQCQFHVHSFEVNPMIVQLDSLEMIGELIVRGTACCEVEGAAYLRTDYLPTRPILSLESYA